MHNQDPGSRYGAKKIYNRVSAARRYHCMAFINGDDTFVHIGGPPIESPDSLTTLRTL